MTQIWQRFLIFYIKQDKIIFWANIFPLACAAFIFVLWGWYANSLPSQLPLFYSLPWGEKQLAPTSQLIILPSIIILISLVNLIICWHLHTSQLPVKRILAVSSSVVAILIFLTSLKIIYTFV